MIFLVVGDSKVGRLYQHSIQVKVTDKVLAKDFAKNGCGLCAGCSEDELLAFG